MRKLKDCFRLLFSKHHMLITERKDNLLWNEYSYDRLYLLSEVYDDIVSENEMDAALIEAKQIIQN